MSSRGSHSDRSRSPDSPRRSSTDSRASSKSPGTSPIRSAAASGANEEEPELPSDAELALVCLQRNDLEGFQRVVGYMPDEPNADGDLPSGPPEDEAGIESVLSAALYPKDGMMAGKNSVFFAAYLNRKEFLAYMAQFSCFQERLVRPVLLAMLSFQRYAMVFHLAATLAPQLLTDSHGENGDTLLHITCHRSKTPVPFIEELIATVKSQTSCPPIGAFVNIQNSVGDTALHILGRCSKGKDGGVAARLLLLAGAQEDVGNAKGQTPRATASNPFVRDLMGLGKGPKARGIPQLDDQSKAEIDAFKDSSQFPEIKKIDVPPVDPQLQLVASPFMTAKDVQPKNKKVKKLGVEEAETLVHRLSVQSVERKEKWMQSKLSVILDADTSRSKKLSGDECNATTQRLHDNELETRGERRTVNVDKYMKPLPASPQLSPEDLEESMSRLGGKRASEATKKKKHDLNEKYSPQKEGRKLTKAELADSAMRLHDESEGHSKDTHSKLFGKYCCPEPTRFGGQNKLDKATQQAMADRLSKRE